METEDTMYSDILGSVLPPLMAGSGIDILFGVFLEKILTYIIPHDLTWKGAFIIFVVAFGLLALFLLRSDSSDESTSEGTHNDQTVDDSKDA